MSPEPGTPPDLVLMRIQTCLQMLALKNNCVHPETKKPYITSVTGGKDNSIEGAQVRVSPC